MIYVWAKVSDLNHTASVTFVVAFQWEKPIYLECKIYVTKKLQTREILFRFIINFIENRLPLIIPRHLPGLTNT